MKPPLVVVMGVSGAGKSVIGSQLAQRLGVPFEDADHLHPAANIAKMARGEPLQDTDRWPWLDVVRSWLASRDAGGVIACSALKRVYRDRLRAGAHVEFLHLEGAVELIARRRADRHGHFMPSSLLASQFAILEPLGPDEPGIVLGVDRGVEEIVADYLSRAARR